MSAVKSLNLDSADLWISQIEASLSAKSLNQLNPGSDNEILIQYSTLNSSGGILILMDINGKKLFEQRLPGWSQVGFIKIPEQAEGLLVLRLWSKEYETSARILVLKE